MQSSSDCLRAAILLEGRVRRTAFYFGDPHTDTFEVFRRAEGEPTWQSAHAGLPGPIEDSVPVDKDQGDEHTEADFATSGGQLYIRTRRMPEGEAEIYRFDDASDQWTKMQKTGLEDESVIEILGTDAQLYAGTEGGLFVWSESDGRWQRAGEGFPDVAANDFHIGPSGTVAAATDGRGVWTAHLQ